MLLTLNNGSAFFIGEGDIVINDPGRSMIVDSQCPTGVFEGFTIIIEILVIKDGTIAEDGDHDTLMSQNGIYRNFVSMRESVVGWNDRKAVL